jgi:hypothetical protein
MTCGSTEVAVNYILDVIPKRVVQEFSLAGLVDDQRDSSRDIFQG